MLADGGFMIERLAKLLHPDGVEVGFDGPAAAAFAETQTALKAKSVTLFEGTLISGGKLARVDILRKQGHELHLIEVKAKSYDSREDEEAKANGKLNCFRKKNGEIYPEWQEYLADVAFQKLVLKELFPDYRVRAFLCMPDKSKTTNIDRLYSLFNLRREQQPGAAFKRIVVDFTGDVEQLREDNFLTQVAVDAEVEYLMETVKADAAKYLASLIPEVKRIVVPLTTACAGCEYRASDADSRDGFKQCWGPMADVTPNILDLYHAGDIGRFNGVTANDLIQSRKVNLLDVPEESLLKADGTFGERNKRQAIQVEHTRDNTEWVSEELAKELRSYKPPFHFIDFETSALAVPYHAGMRPYEQIAFQWSCHRLDTPKGKAVHTEWINVTDAFPNFEFAETLMKQIGTDGTVFMWATHENTILYCILEQMKQRRYRNDALEQWLKTVTTKGWLIDMNQLTLKHFFHPLMKGRTSIKKVVDALWKSDPALREEFPEYQKVEAGQFLSPYQALPPLTIQGEEVVVAEGTGAIRAYEAMMVGFEKNDKQVRLQWRDLLLQYCKLDTTSMLMVWRHWNR